MASSTRDWAADLRAAIKQTFRLGGFTVRESRGSVQLQKRWRTGERQTVALPIEWRPGITLEVLDAIAKINGHMQQGMGLQQAAALLKPVAEGSTARTAGTNWEEVAAKFKAAKLQSGRVKDTTYAANYQRVVDQLLAVLAGGGVTTGRAALEQLRQGDPGSRGRVVRIERAAQLLRFAVREVGVDERWLPPATDVLAELKGAKAPNAPKVAGQGQAVPLMDDAFLELLDSIPDPRWRLAVGLLGVFGLRPVELRYCRAEGSALRVEYSKRAGRGQTEPRTVQALDPVERPGLGQQLLMELSAGLVALPPLGSDDGRTADAVKTYLGRRPVWQRLRTEARAAGLGDLRPYSLRHGYAYRSAMTYGLPARAAAALMGHGVQTHLQHYGRWCDAAGVADAVQSARARVLQST